MVGAQEAAADGMSFMTRPPTHTLEASGAPSHIQPRSAHRNLSWAPGETSLGEEPRSGHAYVQSACTRDTRSPPFYRREDRGPEMTYLRASVVEMELNHSPWTLGLVLFLLSHSEGGPQEAEESSRSSQGSWKLRHLCSPSLTALRLLSDPVGIASLSVPSLQKSSGEGLDSGLPGTEASSSGPPLCPPPPGPPLCPSPRPTFPSPPGPPLCLPFPQAHLCVPSLLCWPGLCVAHIRGCCFWVGGQALRT